MRKFCLDSKHILRVLFFSLLIAPLTSHAAFNLGVGTSSFTYGRPAPSLNLGFEADSKWGFDYQSEGVRTSIYAQNAWTVAAYKTLQETQSGILGATLGGGLGTTYMLRSYRTSTTAATDKSSDLAIGPYLSVRFNVGMFYVGFNTLLGLTGEIQQHIVLNYQDVSHVVIGVSL